MSTITSQFCICCITWFIHVLHANAREANKQRMGRHSYLEWWRCWRKRRRQGWRRLLAVAEAVGVVVTPFLLLSLCFLFFALLFFFCFCYLPLFLCSALPVAMERESNGGAVRLKAGGGSSSSPSSYSVFFRLCLSLTRSPCQYLLFLLFPSFLLFWLPFFLSQKLSLSLSLGFPSFSLFFSFCWSPSLSFFPPYFGIPSLGIYRQRRRGPPYPCHGAG